MRASSTLRTSATAAPSWRGASALPLGLLPCPDPLLGRFLLHVLTCCRSHPPRLPVLTYRIDSVTCFSVLFVLSF